MSAPYLHYAERDLDDPQCRNCGVPASWCLCGPEIDRFPEEPMQSRDRQDGAISSWEPTQEPWHLEPPSDDSAEDRQERDWTYLAGECAEFIGRYGAPALMRCVGEAIGEALRKK